MEQKKHTPQYIKDQVIKLEIDQLLDDEEERPEPLDPYDLSGPSINLEEDAKFVNGVRENPNAYKKEKPADRPMKPAYTPAKPAYKEMPPATNPPLKVPKRTKASISESYMVEIMSDINGTIALGPVMTTKSDYLTVKRNDELIKVPVDSIKKKMWNGQFVSKMMDVPGGSRFMAILKYDLPQLLVEQ